MLRDESATRRFVHTQAVDATGGDGSTGQTRERRTASGEGTHVLHVLASVSILAVTHAEPSASCAWPSTAVMHTGPALCSGTLIHPEVVVYDADCPLDYPAVGFGDDVPSASLDFTDYCVRNPDPSVPVAYCRLLPGIHHVPIVPVMMGCELEQLAPGLPVTMVGFGSPEMPDAGGGTKRHATAEVMSIEPDSITVFSEDGAAICTSDVGGPGMVRLDDGTWRVFGIASDLASGCWSFSTYFPLNTAMPWLEEDTGLDLTPCHDADGTWNPGEDCREAPLSPGDGDGSWPEACEVGPVGGWSATCGPVSAADGDAPAVVLLGPAGGDAYELDGETATVVIDATADDGPGWGIDVARLVIDGEAVSGGDDPRFPYGWEIGLPEGRYEIAVEAVDRAGNVGVSDTIEIVVGDPPPPAADDGGSEGDGGGSESGGDEGSDDDGDAPAQTDDDSEGCSVGGGQRRSAFIGFVLVALARRRRIG